MNRAEEIVWKLQKLGYQIHWPLPGEHTAHIFPVQVDYRQTDASELCGHEITHTDEQARARLVEELIERLAAKIVR